MKTLKRWLRQLLLKEELEDIKKQRIEIETRLTALQQIRKESNITALVREQLSGFDSSLLDSDKGILEEFGEDTEAQNTFLNHVKDLYENPARLHIQKYLCRNQIQFGMIEAETLEALNFSRATINGIQLYDEEVDSLYGQWVKLHTPQEGFDEHEVV